MTQFLRLGLSCHASGTENMNPTPYFTYIEAKIEIGYILEVKTGILST